MGSEVFQGQRRYSPHQFYSGWWNPSAHMLFGVNIIFDPDEHKSKTEEDEEEEEKKKIINIYPYDGKRDAFGIKENVLILKSRSMIMILVKVNHNE